MEDRTLPAVAFGSLGGTITMTGDDGAQPTLGADALVRAAPGVDAIARISHHTLATTPGASLRFDDLVGMLRWAEAEVAAGADGVVVAQGTDTIEETAFFADLHWDHPEPLVVTGAMRTPASPSADGPANVLAAARVAGAASARHRGVLVVLDDTVHLAARVREEHSTALAAFRSSTGAAGAVVEGEVVFHAPPSPHRALPLPDPVASARTLFVPTVLTGLDDDGRAVRLLAAAEPAPDGLVVAALGAGHVSRHLADAVGEVAATMPVVAASRTGAGTTLRRTYGFPGSERDLAARGVLLGGWLDPVKARVLLWSLLAAGHTGDGLARAFADVADHPDGTRAPLAHHPDGTTAPTAHHPDGTDAGPTRVAADPGARAAPTTAGDNLPMTDDRTPPPA